MLDRVAYSALCPYCAAPISDWLTGSGGTGRTLAPSQVAEVHAQCPGCLEIVMALVLPDGRIVNKRDNTVLAPIGD